MPVIFLLLLGLVYGKGDGADSVYGLEPGTYLVAAISTLGIVGAAFNNIAMTLTFQREMGTLKRLRGTPLPTVVFVLARTISAVLNALLIVGVLLVTGWLVFGAQIGLQSLVGVAIVTVIGAVCFASLGFAITIVIRSLSAATPITNAITLPLYFISGVFGEVENLPQILADIGKIFPVSHLGACFFETLSPHADGIVAFSLKDIAVVLAWGVVGLVLAIWKFRWEPQGDV